MNTDPDQRRVWIRGTGDFREATGEVLAPLKPVVQEALGSPVRRVGRFIQLALIGTGRCVGSRTPASDTAVYMSSARGDLETTLDVVETLFRERRPPMPLSFINTVSNAPCYYVARHFGLAGRSNFLCSRCFAFESVLELTALDLKAGYMDAALAGSVDIATEPLADHRHRLRIASDAAVAEGSHWLWLQAGECPGDAVGELVATRDFPDRDHLIDWLAKRGLSGADCRFAAGQFAHVEDIAAIQAATGLHALFQPPPAPGFYDSQAGGTINAFLNVGDRPFLVHVNGEIDGPRCSAVVVRRVATPDT